MPQTTRLATCCYCGTRSALVLAGASSHRLACGACGAPLTQMKQLPCKGTHGPVEAARPLKAPPPPRPMPHSPKSPKSPKSTKKAKKRKSLSRKLLSEAWDLLEDIFD
jgi:hypothetical protein